MEVHFFRFCYFIYLVKSRKGKWFESVTDINFELLKKIERETTLYLVISPVIISTPSVPVDAVRK